jgi:hypothetical protein
MKPSTLVMWVIFAITLVGAIVGVALGVHFHEEPGLDPRMPRWARDAMPLGLCVATYGHEWDAETGLAADADDLDSASYAISVINRRLGFRAYEMTAGDDCDVFLDYGVPAEAGWIDPGGNAHYDGAQCYAETSNVHGEIEQLVVQHELGHCLGLAHDDFERSIMRPVQRETEPRRLPPWISDDDRALLREMYAPE